MSKIHRAITEPITGYPLNARWSVVVPSTADVVNLIANPSAELGTTGYVPSFFGTMDHTADKQRRGAFSVRYTCSDVGTEGLYYNSVSLVSGTLYIWSFDFWGQAGVKFRTFISDTGFVELGGVRNWTATGRWQRISLFYHEVTGSAARYLSVFTAQATPSAFYLDGMMMIANPTGNTDVDWNYFDGDTVGFVPTKTDFFWNGTPHASTSTMRAHARAGGKVLSLEQLGFTLEAIMGTGMYSPNNIAIPLSLPGGSQYQRTLAPSKTFDLVGSIQATSLPDLERKHRDLVAALDVRRQPITQPLILRYTPIGVEGQINGETADIVCNLVGGLEGQRDNYYQENLDLRFTTYDPSLAQLYGTEGAELDVRDSFTVGNVVRRDGNGIWSTLQASGLSGEVAAALPLTDGRWLVGGDFINAGGVANADYLAFYDFASDTFSAVNATPLNAVVACLLQLPNGNVLLGGDFTNAGGDANADYLALLTLSTGAYSSLNATPLNSGVNALALLPTGNVAFGGGFTNAGSANGDYLALLTLSTGAYSAFNATPLNNIVTALALSPDGFLYFGGAFTDAGGDANADYVARIYGLIPAAYSSLTRPGVPILNGSVTALRSTSDGRLLIGGSFTNVGGVATWDYLVYYNGSSFEAPIISINNVVYSVDEVRPGIVMVGGDFSSAAGIALFDGLFQFSGNTLIPIDLDLPGTPVVGEVVSRANGELIVGFKTTGTAYTSGTTSLTNNGTALTKPVVVITHPTTASVVAPLYSLRSLTTGKIISFNLTLLIGETLTIDLERSTVVSSLRGNLISSVLPGSDLADFYLVPGENIINLFSSLASGSLPSAYIYWVPKYAGLTGLN